MPEKTHWSDPKLWFTIIGLGVTAVGNAFVANYRLGQAEKKIAEISIGIQIANTFDARMTKIESDQNVIKQLVIKMAEKQGIEVYIP